MFLNIIHNYEVTKLVVDYPNVNNLIMLTAIALISIAFLKRLPEPSALLDRQQTDQLRGLAILFVILGHFWEHVSQVKPVLYWEGSALAVFFIISGFGLMMSTKDRPLLLKPFVMGRIKRVMLLYWIVTPFFLFLDYAILHRTYRWSDIVLTMLGINANVAVNHIDYVRWYITFILVWYVIFFLSARITKPSRRIICLFAASVIIFPFDYYISHFGFEQVAAFPVGCALAQYHEKLKMVYQKGMRWFLLAASFIIISVISYKTWFYFGHEPNMPSLVFRAFREGSSLLFGLSIIVFFAFFGACRYGSVFLRFCGKISYEVFLLHGPFLIKYDFLIPLGISPIVVSLGIFLAFIFAFALFVQRGITFVTRA